MPAFDLLIDPVWSDDLAAALGCEHRGDRRWITNARTPDAANDESLVFVGSTGSTAVCDGTVIASAAVAGPLQEAGATVILSSSPRLEFARALSRLQPPVPAGIAAGAHVDSDAEVHPTARVETGAVIDGGARIGPGTRIRSMAVIRSSVVLGERCDVGEHAVLGNDGLTVPIDADGVPHPMRHLGGLRIGAGVRVGPLVTIGRGTLDDAVVGESCVIGPQVNIGHNGRIGDCCIITGGARLAGGVRLGRGAWIGTGAVIHQKVSVGDGVTVGGGAVVTADVAPGETVGTIPAMSIRQVAQLLRGLR